MIALDGYTNILTRANSVRLALRNFSAQTQRIHSHDVHHRRARREILTDTRSLFLHDAIERRDHRSVFQLLSRERQLGSSLREHALTIADLFVCVLVTAFGNFERCGRRIEFSFRDHALLDQSRRAIAIVTGFIEHCARLSHSCSLFRIDAIVGAVRRETETCTRLGQRSFCLLHAETIVFGVDDERSLVRARRRCRDRQRSCARVRELLR